MFQSTDGPDARWAVRMVIIRYVVESEARDSAADTSDLMARATDQLDRLYRGRSTAREILKECE